jgi:hypothetical protein
MTWGRIGFIRDGTTHTFPFTEHVMDGSDHACVIGIIHPACVLPRPLEHPIVDDPWQFHIPFGLRPLSQYSLYCVSPILPHFSFSHHSRPANSSLFLYPLYNSTKLTAPLRRLAKRTLWAALVALVTSATNVAVLMVLHGQELGWVCLGSCTADVTINALALFFVTGSYDDPQPQKPIDTVSTPVVRRRSAMPILQTTSAHQPGNFFCPSFRCQVPLVTKWNTGVSHLSVHFPDTGRPDRCTTLDYDAAVRTDIANSSGTGTSNFSTTFGSTDDEKSKYHANDSYISPNGMVTSEGTIGKPPFHSPNHFDLFLNLKTFQLSTSTKFEGNRVSNSPMWPLMKCPNAQRQMGKKPKFKSCP